MALLSVTGCHSAFVDATIENQSSSALNLVEVDYPSASFGLQTLAPAATYHYRFKIQGSGNVKLTFTDTQGKAHTSSGPELENGQEGALRITVDRDAAAHFDFILRGR